MHACHEQRLVFFQNLKKTRKCSCLMNGSYSSIIIPKSSIAFLQRLRQAKRHLLTFTIVFIHHARTQ